MKRLMIILAEGFEEIEALSVVDILRRANVICDVVSLENKYVKGCHDIDIKSDVLIDTLEENQYDGIILPGGMPGAENLSNNEKVISIVKKFFQEDKLICAICAAPMVLGKADVVKGKNLTCYPGFEEYLNEANIKEDLVVVDKNIITGKGPAAAFEFSFKILEVIGLEDKKRTLKQGMMFPKI